MDARDLTEAQLDALLAKLAPLTHYLAKLRDRVADGKLKKVRIDGIQRLPCIASA